MFGKKCTEGGHHKFEPRYDEIPVEGAKVTPTARSPQEIRPLLFYNVYVHDICVWCGTIIKKS